MAYRKLTDRLPEWLGPKMLTMFKHGGVHPGLASSAGGIERVAAWRNGASSNGAGSRPRQYRKCGVCLMSYPAGDILANGAREIETGRACLACRFCRSGLVNSHFPECTARFAKLIRESSPRNEGYYTNGIVGNGIPMNGEFLRVARHMHDTGLDGLSLVNASLFGERMFSRDTSSMSSWCVVRVRADDQAAVETADTLFGIKLTRGGGTRRNTTGNGPDSERHDLIVPKAMVSEIMTGITKLARMASPSYIYVSRVNMSLSGEVHQGMPVYLFSSMPRRQEVSSDGKWHATDGIHGYHVTMNNQRLYETEWSDDRGRMLFGFEVEIIGGSERDGVGARQNKLMGGLQLLESKHPDIGRMVRGVEQDGSLESGGGELISQAAPLDVQRAFLRNWPDHKTWHCRSHRTTCCGLHVHVSRAGLGSVCEDNLVRFMKAPAMQSFLDKIARRTESSYCKRNALVLGGDNNHGAVDFTHGNSIEFRLFRGSLAPMTILASIEFCYAAIEFCRRPGLKNEDFTPRAFVEFASGGALRKECEKFLDYVSSRDKENAVFIKDESEAEVEQKTQKNKG